jgi:two-component system, chemotaxis family, sensor kinase CheA
VSSRIDLAEFLTAYLAEAEEQLTIANAQFLAIEQSLKNDRPHPRAVRDLFRALHTIKGLSSMVGVEPIVAIAHRMEAVVRTADRLGTLALSALETLGEGLRAIETRLRAVRDGAPVPAPPNVLLEALDALESDGAAESNREGFVLDLDPALAEKLATFETEQLVQGLATGKRALQLQFVPSQERAAKGESISGVRERLAAVAEVVKVFPVSLPPSAEAPVGLAFILLLVTTATDEELAHIAGVVVSAIATIGLTRRPAPGSAASASLALVPETPQAEPEAEPRSLLRVDVARVDDAMEKLGSLIVSRSRLTRAIAKLGEAAADTRELKQIATEISRQLRDLRSSILNVRMVRVGETLERLPLMVRGLRRATGKQVRLELDAGSAELDKAVAERIFPAILHLVRNAVDHGIELPAERRAANKEEEGVIRINASSRSNTQLELSVSDDGRGIDRARVASRASADVPTTDAALLELLCLPGLSTRDEVTTTSGRGMGMDIVKRVVVEQLGGELALSTRPGAGSTFSLRVPLTIAIVDAFVIVCGAERFVVPVSSVEEIVEIDETRIIMAPITLPGGATQLGIFERRGETVPLIDLAALLRIALVPGPRPARGLVVRRAGQPVAFVLDRVLGQQEAVVRPLVDPLVNLPGVAGATDLGDGRPTLVLDLVTLAGTRPTPMLPGTRSPKALPSPVSQRQSP